MERRPGTLNKNTTKPGVFYIFASNMIYLYVYLYNDLPRQLMPATTPPYARPSTKPKRTLKGKEMEVYDNQGPEYRTLK